MAQTYDEAIQELSAYIRTRWTAAGGVLANLAYEDQDFDPPANKTSWARLTIKHHSGAKSLGSGTSAVYRRRGQLTLQVFTAIGEEGPGAVGARQLGGPIVQDMESVGAVGNIWFRNSVMREIGVDGVWYQIHVQTDFVYDRTT